MFFDFQSNDSVKCSAYVKFFNIIKDGVLSAVETMKVVRVDWLRNLENYKEDYNVSLFYVVCTVTVRIFCSRCDASYSIGRLLIYISKPFVICTR